MLIRKNDDGSGEINVLSANDLILRTGDTTRLTIASTGLPTFEKSDGSAAWYMTLKNTNASGYGSGIDFWAAWQIDSIKARINGSPSGGGQGGSLRFYTEDTAGNLDEALALEKDQKATFAGDVSVGGDFSVTGVQSFGATTFTGVVEMNGNQMLINGAAPKI